MSSSLLSYWSWLTAHLYCSSQYNTKSKLDFWVTRYSHNKCPSMQQHHICSEQLEKVMQTQSLCTAPWFRLSMCSISGSEKQHHKMSLSCTSPSLWLYFSAKPPSLKTEVNNWLCRCQRQHRISQKTGETWLFERHICERQVPHTEQDTADQLPVSFASCLLDPVGFLPVHVTSNFGNKMPYTEKKK